MRASKSSSSESRQRPVLDAAAASLITNTIGHAVLTIIARGERLSHESLLRDLQVRASSAGTLDSRLAAAAHARLLQDLDAD